MQLTIRVGAAVDRSLSEAFRPLIASGNAAKTALERQAAGASAARVKAVKTGVSAEEKEYSKLVKQTEKWKREEVKEVEKAAAARTAAAEKAASAEIRANERSQREQTRATEREMAKRAKDQEKAKKANEKGRLFQLRAPRSADVVGSAERGLRRAGSFAASVAGDLARGAGVDMSFGSMVQKNNELQQQATNLSNAGFMSGSATNGLRVDPNALMQQSFAVGKETGTDANEVMEGLEKFVAKTGDLKLGRDMIRDMAVAAKATGTELSNMADAAGDVASNIEEGPDKAEKVKAVMTAIAAQGKVGAVEIKQLATQMAKLAAASSQFEGGAAKNMVVFGAMAQMSRQKGGAASASQAANTIGAFTSTFAKGARLDAFEKFGVKVQGANGQIRDQKSIILDSIRAANDAKFGGPANANRNMGDMFKDVNARRAMKGWETEYAQAGGGDAGLKAVSDKFDALVNSSISAQEAQESFAAAMGTSKSQAEVFNQTMRETVNKLQGELTPALIQLAPLIIQAAQAFANAVSWITGKSAISGQIKSTGNNVAMVTDAANKGIKAGSIGSGQEALGTAAETEARATLEAAKAEAVKARAEAKPTALGTAGGFVLDNFALGAGGGRLLGQAMGLGQGVGAGITGKGEEKALDAESRAVAAEALWKQMHDSNVEIKNALLTGVLKVRVEGGGALGPPGVSDAGRMPSSDAPQ